MASRSCAPARLLAAGLVLALAALAAPAPAPAQTVTGLVWRNVGPFRAGRVSAVSGAVGEPGVFYAGFPTGGLWRTSNAGTTWEPVFDSVTSVSAIGAVEVAPSDTGVIYVGTGDMPTGGNINEGDGVYRSADAGRTWRHLGLDSTKQIPSILVDPKDPNLVLVAAQGDLHAKGGQRGLYRSTDGGRTWTRTLFVDDSTGVQKLAWANDQPGTVFATTDRHYVTPRASARVGFGGAGGSGPTGTAIYKSTDEGVTWQEVKGTGLPRLFGRTSIAVAMRTGAQRVFLIGNFGLYRSDDGGGSWRRMDSTDSRVGNGQGGYNCGVYVSSSNPDVVITINTSSYISTDGGNTFTGFKGAPGGDDPQQLWIDPTDGQRMLLGMDQGATVTLDGGRTWSLWYNQSTEQVYHISVDNSWPYWIYASQQDAGAIRTRSRGNYGAITPMDWSPVGAWEWGTDVADPRDPSIVYGSGVGVQKITWPSEQIIDVGPGLDPKSYLRTSRSQPLLWAPWNPRELLFGTQYVMATTDGGGHWTKLSPDLGYPKGVTPPAESLATAPVGPGVRVAARGGAIESMAASTVRPGIIWVGTNNGLIKVTRDDGKTWQDVSIPDTPDSNQADVTAIDASHQDPAEAYVAVDGHATGDYAPYLYRTRDYGRTWTKIVTGLPTGEPSGSFAQLIRADTKKAGLLFAGTESGMFVSFDDGDRWQSLQLNLPNTSYRDAVITGNDLVVGTYGRGIWILDDISPLRQLTAEVEAEDVHLFKPGSAIRVHRNTGQDTPFPPEVPHALNPPDGAIIYYWLKNKPAGAATLDVLDASGTVVRHLSSVPQPPVSEAAHPPEPSFWLAAPQVLPADAGINRTNWDLRYDAPPAFSHSFEINANPGLTPPSPEGPMALPGTYTIKLTVDGKSYTSTVTVRNDPRSPATAPALAAQHALQMRIVRGMRETWDAHQQAASLLTALAADTGAALPSDVADAARALDARVDSVAGTTSSGGPAFFRRGPRTPSFLSLNGGFGGQLNGQDLADMAPTPAMLADYTNSCQALRKALTTWAAIRGPGLAALNAKLAGHHLTALADPGPALDLPVCTAAPRHR